MGQATSPTPAAARIRARRGEGYRLRGELVEAASALLVELGDPNRLSVRAVAAAAGVTPPSIYRHFADKQALLVAVLVERWAELHDLVVAAAAETDDALDALRRFCLAYVRFAEERPGHYRMLFSTAAPAGITDDIAGHPGAPTFLALVGLVERCLTEGVAANRGRDSWFLAMQLWLSGHGLVDLRLGQRFPFPWPPSEVLLDAVLSDLGLAQGSRDREGSQDPSTPD